MKKKPTRSQKLRWINAVLRNAGNSYRTGSCHWFAYYAPKSRRWYKQVLSRFGDPLTHMFHWESLECEPGWATPNDQRIMWLLTLREAVKQGIF